MRILMKENVEPTNKQSSDFGQLIYPVRVSFRENRTPLSVRLLLCLRLSVCHLKTMTE